MARSQAKRQARFDSPLGPDALLLRSFRGDEELGRLFEFEVELLSDDGKIPFKDIVAQNVTVALDRPDGETRYFNGYVSRFRQLGDRGRLAAYTATVVPWLWFLKKVSDCRIWQNKTVPDIVKEIFRERGFSDFDDSGLSGNYTPWENCVQYRETDFNFVSRLMEHEGIYYYFSHEEGKHTLMLSDSPSGHGPTKGYEQVAFHPRDKQVHREETIWSWTVEQEVRSGRYALNDFDFKVPGKALVTAANVPRDHAYADLELYDYPGAFEEHGDGDTYARVRIEEEQADFEVATARTDCRAIATGATFKLEDHPRDDRNVEYLVTCVSHNYGSQDADSTRPDDDADTDPTTVATATEPDYSCAFKCIEATRPFRAARTTPKPIVQGPQTAVVTGPPGETIHCDKLGRVKVHFHWDRAGKMDDNASCWIRVSQNWGGGGWGGMFVPHVGHEVIVSFLEGDPDLPIITGRVYNGDKAPPLGLPGNKTKSAITDHGGNKIIMEGNGGDQQILMHSPHSNTTFAIGAKRNPPPGASIFTDAFFTFRCGKDFVTNVDGEKNTYVNGDLLCLVNGNQIYTTVGHYRTDVYGWNWTTVALWNHTNLVGLNTVLSLAGQVTYTLHSKELCKSYIKRAEKEKTEMVDTLKEFVKDETHKVLGECKQDIKHLKWDVETMIADLKSLEMKVKGEMKYLAEKTFFEAETTMFLKAGSRVTIDAPKCSMNGDLFVWGTSIVIKK